MELHHDKHHKAYVDNLNKTLEPYRQLAELTVEDLLHRLDQVPETIRTGVETTAGPSIISCSGTSSDLARSGRRRAVADTI
jgi:superoxide dismutase, Fe-Mn family